MSETSVSTIPTLTEEHIQARVGSQSFQRGKQYFRDGAIFDARQQGTTLKAGCLGSQGGPYRLRVTFGPDGISAANCTCPVGAGGYCKHIAALLLTWRARPEAFLAMEELDTTLEQRSKEELVALVKQMLRQEPGLESLLEVPLPVAGKRSAPVDAAVYRRQAAAAFTEDEESWQTPVDIAGALLAITSIGEGFARQHDYASAAAVYEAVALEAAEHFEEYYDDSGSLTEVIADCIGGLGECLANEQDAAVRERILRALFAVYRCDVNFGGIGMSDEAPELIIEHATPEERSAVAAWVREAIPPGQGSSSSWRREAYGGFLLALELDTLDDEAFLQVCRETGRIHDLVDRLLSLGRIDEAVQAATEASDYDLLQMTNLFERHGYGQLAEQLMRERSERSEDARVLDWLKDRYKARGDLDTALDLAGKLFRLRPDLTRYRELRDLAHQIDRRQDRVSASWEAMRPQLLAFLREQRWNDLLIAIYLDDGEIDQALEGLRTLRSSVMGYSYGLYGEESLAMRVARAAEETRPDAALDIYSQQVERLIAGRNRGSYSGAARLLVRMRDIYVKSGEGEAWSSYLGELRERYRTLRALKEEIAAVGL